MAQSIAKTRRPQAADPDDIVLARALHFAEWARKNVVLISVAAGVIAVLVGGLLWYRISQDRREEQAAIAFLPVEQAVLTGEETVATRELQLFIQRHDGTVYADEARVLLGQVHLRAGRPADAVAAVEDVAQRLDSPLGPQAALLLAAAQEAAGQQEAAIATYLRVADQAQATFRQEEGLAGAARLREAAGDYAGAAELYRRLVELTEGSPSQTLYEMRQAEAEARAAAP